MQALLIADSAMVAVAAGLLVVLIFARARSRGRRGRAKAARARFEDLIAEQLVSPGPIAPPHDRDAFERGVLLEVASSALLELRGAERDRWRCCWSARGWWLSRPTRCGAGARRRAGSPPTCSA
jgi:hypothetical protein